MQLTDVHVLPLSSRCLAPEYRRPLVVAELLGFRGDLVCLQEVDDKMFSLHLQPQLGAEGEGRAAPQPRRQYAAGLPAPGLLGEGLRGVRRGGGR